MNLFFSRSTANRAHYEISLYNEPVEAAKQPPMDDSLDEGDEYVDDSLRMTEQTFDQE